MKVIVVLSCLLQCFFSYCQVETVSGTLVIVTPSKSGLVIAADRRFTELGTDTTYYEATKTKRINNYYGYVIAGTREERDVPLDLRGFYAVDVIDNFFNEKSSISIDKSTMNDLGEVLKKSYRESKSGLLFSSNGDGFHFLSNLKPNRVICEVFVYGYSVIKKEYEIGHLALHYADEPNAEYIIFSKSSLEISTWIAIGQVWYLNELRKSHDSVTPKHNKKLVKRMMTNETKLYKMKDVVEFSMIAIKETSKRYVSVGNTVDITLVSPDGYKFIKRE